MYGNVGDLDLFRVNIVLRRSEYHTETSIEFYLLDFEIINLKGGELADTINFNEITKALYVFVKFKIGEDDRHTLINIT